MRGLAAGRMGECGGRLKVEYADEGLQGNLDGKDGAVGDERSLVGYVDLLLDFGDDGEGVVGYWECV